MARPDNQPPQGDERIEIKATPIRLPEDLLAAIDQIAATEQVSRNAVFNAALRFAVAHQRPWVKTAVDGRVTRWARERERRKDAD
ncbi:ribbon-helix-helix domain-containing protein [Oryzihumus leptocrescens]|uniref:Ribbon-helix-helix CopG family protein n=1 Tax=Oryzihumus leptocrescens TaxID=297536 RepID=A0A542ZEJ7_9MICO|nr:ribbon-helix-helix domain-containing protein [Oryzihumus leptocrescens]TQL58764.1 ribbon-helix-helix CopG family protein [Oryzihumus leptocrescens]